MLIGILVVVLAPIWAPLAVLLGIAFCLIAGILVLAIAFVLLYLLVKMAVILFKVHDFMIALRTDVMKDANSELETIPWYRLVRLYARRLWRKILGS